MSARRIRVVKLGGSLFDLPALPALLDAWLNDQQPPGAVQVLVAGGGALVDAVRRADRLHDVGPEAAHWMCISLMGVTARLLARLLPGARLLSRWDQLTAEVAGPDRARLVFDCEHFLRQQEPQLAGPKLTHDWRTTSDSIAARLAAALAAEELVLLKSREPGPAGGGDWRAAAAAGLVDEHFPCLAPGLNVRWVNLRA